MHHYFDNESVTVVTNYPIRDIFSRPDATGRVTELTLTLSSYNLDFKSCKAIKGQALSDFLLQSRMLEESLEYDNVLKAEGSKAPWRIYVVGVANSNDGGMGILFFSTEGAILEHVIKINFQDSNNEAEYEATIARLKLTKALGARIVNMFTYSKLVVNQVNELF